jgi:hypothetical protein
VNNENSEFGFRDLKRTLWGWEIKGGQNVNIIKVANYLLMC